MDHRKIHPLKLLNFDEKLSKNIYNICKFNKLWFKNLIYINLAVGLLR